ncbi:MAG: cytochrome c oxidase subunit 2A [Trueperaceae bacterium]|nr:cytochrome c oxidase subunit 2A [Anaerolineae bacterium]UCH27719.1 MAG: cytochrome c oxidase subunit 2A [Trueperaceae bacterium]
MSDKRPSDAPEVPEPATDKAPSGAILITALLAVTILAVWLGTFVLYLIRS